MRAFIGAPAGALVRARGRGALCVRRRAAVRAAAPPVAAKNGAAEGVPTPSNGEDPTPAPGSGIDPLGADEGDLASMPKEELKSAYGIAKFDPDSELVSA